MQCSLLSVLPSPHLTGSRMNFYSGTDEEEYQRYGAARLPVDIIRYVRYV